MAGKGAGAPMVFGPPPSAPHHPRISLAREEPLDHVARQSCRAQRVGVDAAPAGLDLRQHFLAAADDGFVEGAGALHLFQEDGGDHLVVEEGGLAVGDFMLERDPEMLGHRFGRRQRAPVVEDGVLHPFQIAGVVHMAHEVDVFGGYADGVEVGDRVTHIAVNSIGASVPIGRTGKRGRISPAPSPLQRRKIRSARRRSPPPDAGRCRRRSARWSRRWGNRAGRRNIWSSDTRPWRRCSR